MHFVAWSSLRSDLLVKSRSSQGVYLLFTTKLLRLLFYLHIPALFSSKKLPFRRNEGYDKRYDAEMITVVHWQFTTTTMLISHCTCNCYADYKSQQITATRTCSQDHCCRITVARITIAGACCKDHCKRVARMHVPTPAKKI